MIEHKYNIGDKVYFLVEAVDYVKIRTGEIKGIGLDEILYYKIANPYPNTEDCYVIPEKHIIDYIDKEAKKSRDILEKFNFEKKLCKYKKQLIQELINKLREDAKKNPNS